MPLLVDNWPPPTPDDVLVMDTKVADEFDVTTMTIFRWDADPKKNFPPKIKTAGNRNGRFRSHLELYKERLWRAALRQRA